MQTLAIVGASLAGLSAARAARSQGFAGELIVIGDEVERPYDRPPLSKDYLLGTLRREDLSLEADGEDLGASWLLGSRATWLDSESRTVGLDDGRSVTADGVVIATGASARTMPELNGLANVFTLRTLADAQSLAGTLVPGGRLVIVGAGFIGAEVASAANTLGMEVTVVNVDPVPFRRQLGLQMGTIVAALHQRHGVELLCDTIEHFDHREGRVTGVRLRNGRCLPADVVLLGIGAVHNTGWLTGSGVETGNGVLCDAGGRTNVPGIVAVGDCAAWFDAGLQTHSRIEHWTGAAERPGLAVAALLDPAAPYAPAKPPYFWSDQYGVKLQFAGHAAGANRIEIETGDPYAHNFLAVYYRGTSPVAVLGMNQPRLFTRWRRALPSAPLTPAGTVPARTLIAS